MPRGIYKRSKEQMFRISQSRIGLKHSVETIEKMRQVRLKNPIKAWLGKKLPSEIIEKIRNSNIGKKHNLVKPRPRHSLETKRKIGLKSKGRNLREKSSLWLGGISFEPYTIDWTDTLKRSIRERDNYMCRLCGVFQNNRTFHVHHIDYNKKNCNPNNLITLCGSCHIKTNYNRNEWERYFKSISI